MNVKQLIILSAVVVALVFLTTFASLYLGEGPTKKIIPDPDPVQPQHLTFAETTFGQPPEADPLDPAGERPSHPTIQERFKPGHHDFWFENVSGGPVKLGLVEGSCTCTKLEACAFPEAKWKGLSESQRSSLAESASWEMLIQKDPRSINIPAGGAGYVRMSWDGDKIGAVELGATLWTEGSSGGVAHTILRAQMLLLDPVICQLEETVSVPTDPTQTNMVRQNEKYLGKLGGGSSSQATFLCWSATRPDFELKPPIKLTTPCVIIDPPQKLSDEELKGLSDKLKLRVQSAYRVNVTVRDQTEDGQQLDLGRFRYQLDLKTDAVPSGFVQAFLLGEVEGPIIVEGTEGQARIDLGHFPMSEDKHVEIRLYTSESDIELRLDGERTRATPFFQAKEPVEIPQTVGKTWLVELKIPAGTVEGLFPNRDKLARPGYDDCAVYLTIHPKGESGNSDRPARRIRVPIYGNATR